MQQPENNRTNFAAMTFVTALCPFKITQGPCSATMDAIYTLISLPLSAVGGEATEETPGVLLQASHSSFLLKRYLFNNKSGY